MPCLCPICKGNLISRHLRRKHAKLYSDGIEATVVNAIDSTSAESVDDTPPVEPQCSLPNMVAGVTRSDETDDAHATLDLSNSKDDGLGETLTCFDEDAEVIKPEIRRTPHASVLHKLHIIFTTS